MVSSTGHDIHTLKDYQRLQRIGIYTVREGLRWHLIEKSKDNYDFSTVLPIIKAMNECKMQVLWDIFHNGWPDHIDISKTGFIKNFTKFTRAFINFLINETDQQPFITPINEISYVAWACAEVGYMYPYYHNRSRQLKKQLVIATIEASEVIWEKSKNARILNIDPSIYVVPQNNSKAAIDHAVKINLEQYEARDMLVGKLEPRLGGDDKYLDIVGVNYYPFNQWVDNCVESSDDVIKSESYNFFKGLSTILEEVYARYRKPLFISETGTEGNQRANWLKYVASEVSEAGKTVPIHGICWYPIVNTLHWDTGRYCPNGLWDLATGDGDRKLYQPLADEMLKLIVNRGWKDNLAQARI
jgi:beta-glucosidase/6-phospho-beta-glucosidase/beta-galactosidase